MKARSIKLLLLAVLIILSAGCDPVARHKMLSTVFDGVPSLPEPEQLCRDYADRKVAELRDELTGKKTVQVAVTAGDRSQHPPYVAKKCDDCHDKTTESGFVKPKQELCYVCHKGFIKGSYVHGPVAAADCLFCHEPHTSRYPALLKKDFDETCAMCHREERMAGSLHKRVAESRIRCVECHNPHSGTAPYFIK